MAKSTNTIWNEGIAIGEARGYEIGLAKGRAKAKNEMITNLILNGKLSDSEIAYYTNSSVSEIEIKRRTLKEHQSQ